MKTTNWWWESHTRTHKTVAENPTTIHTSTSLDEDECITFFFFKPFVRTQQTFYRRCKRLSYQPQDIYNMDKFAQPQPHCDCQFVGQHWWQRYFWLLHIWLSWNFFFFFTMHCSFCFCLAIGKQYNNIFPLGFIVLKSSMSTLKIDEICFFLFFLVGREM